MVVKTELCAFSEYRIYPGHGIRFVRRDGQPVTLGSSKAKCLLNNRKKPSKLVWTQTWRRLNKKGKEEGIARKKTRRVVKIARAFVGTSIDEIKTKKVAAKPANAAVEAALKEVKDKSKKAASAKVHGHISAYVPKHQRSNVNARGGAKY